MAKKKKLSHVLIKIGSKVGFFMVLANFLGPIGFKVFLITSAVNSHIQGKRSTKVTVYSFSSFKLQYKNFTKKEPNLFLSFDLSGNKSKKKGVLK